MIKSELVGNSTSHQWTIKITNNDDGNLVENEYTYIEVFDSSNGSTDPDEVHLFDIGGNDLTSNRELVNVVYEELYKILNGEN